MLVLAVTSVWLLSGKAPSEKSRLLFFFRARIFAQKLSAQRCQNTYVYNISARPRPLTEQITLNYCTDVNVNSLVHGHTADFFHDGN